MAVGKTCQLQLKKQEEVRSVFYFPYLFLDHRLSLLLYFELCCMCNVPRVIK